MNQAELIAAIAVQNQNTTNKVQVKAILDAQAEVVHAQLAIGGEVSLPGIGKISVKRTEERIGRNPRTGESLVIAAKTKPHFVASSALKAAAN
jgi:DNA-binding protein HU-beta